LSSCHNCILGVGLTSEAPATFQASLVNVLSNLPTPVHCIQAPLGVDPDTGAVTNASLFASSTLSLGIPLRGLHSAREHLGRHYVCDISFARQQYMRDGQDLSLLFADQPVVQLIAAEDVTAAE
ncbi:MAG: hypothetical protein EBZ48_11405, partial [Proteobacteria bacterium]|nr:hypothetical protein [Pseudomonadota bacterium]